MRDDGWEPKEVAIPALDGAKRRSEPRKHHYIPLMLQRRFADEELCLWSFDKTHPDRGVVRRPIKRLFRVPHLYTIHRRDGSRDTSTETRLSAIEARAGPVIARVVEGARAGRGGGFSEAERRALVDLFIAQHRRSPDLHRAVRVRQIAADIIADTVGQWTALFGEPSPDLRAFLTSPDYVAQMRHQVMAENAASPLQMGTAVMMLRGFSVARIVAPRRAFILGSNPFARFMSWDTRRQDLDDPGAELWLPVAHDIAIGSAGPASHSAHVELDDARIRKFNEMVALASTVFASASRELVEAMTRIALRAHKRQGPWEAP